MRSQQSNEISVEVQNVPPGKPEILSAKATGRRVELVVQLPTYASDGGSQGPIREIVLCFGPEQDPGGAGVGQEVRYTIPPDIVPGDAISIAYPLTPEHSPLRSGVRYFFVAFCEG